MDEHARDFLQREYNIDLRAARRRIRQLTQQRDSIDRAIAVECEEITELKRRAYQLGLNPYGED